MKLEIITPDKGIEIDKEICLLEAEGAKGSFGILNNHIPFISLLKEDALVKYQTKSTNHVQSLKVKSAVLETSSSEIDKKKQSVVRIIASQVQEI